MPKAFVNGQEIEFEKGMTALQVAELAGEEIPRFCYHERLKIAGNCRMCLVEVQPGPPKPAASCAMPANEGMKIFTNTPMVKKAREGVMEFLLMNHPLDCPICDQAGECDLQDQAMAYGKGESRFKEHKRAVKDKYMGPIVKTQMTRCIHCTRCVRFMEEVAGVPELGATGRGEHMEVGTYIEKGLSSELSGNIIDLCPVGALTSKPYAFKARPWELKKTETIDVLDAVGSNIRVDSRGNEVLRILPSLNEDINEEWISDKTRYGFEGLKYQRLDKPYIRKRNAFKEASWEEAIDEVANVLTKVQPERLATIAGDLLDVESMFAMKNLLDNLNFKNYDCRQDGAMYDPLNRASYIFNTTISGIEQADLILIIGANPRYEAPLVNARIRKVFVAKNIPIAVIGSKVDLTYKYDYLGHDSGLIEDILSERHIFSEKLRNAKQPLIIVGNSIYKRTDSEGIISKIFELCQKFNVIREDWNGFNALQKVASRVGGLDIGFVPPKNGRDIISINQGLRANDFDVVILHGADEIDTRYLEKPFVIYIGHHGDAGASVADIILPSAAYTEKDATYVNLEGRPQKAFRATFPVGEAKEDFEIIAMIAKKLEKKSFDSLEEIRNVLAEKFEVFANINKIIKANVMLSSSSVVRVNKTPIECENFNFYFTDAISRHSKTMQACNKEFAEINNQSLAARI
jgi:NADH-quinone oxidoreductase subunit G